MKSEKIGYRLLLGALLILQSCAQRPFQEEKRCQFIQKVPSMGSFFEVQLPNVCDSQYSEKIMVQIKNRLDFLESEMSLYQSQSALSRLNKMGTVGQVSADFTRNIEHSKEHHKKTEGFFNIAILPVLTEIEKSFKKTNQPPKNLNKFRSLLDMDKIKIENATVTFLERKMQITLDGIAKGYAVDLIASDLEEKGILNYLLNFSGNMRWMGRRSDGSHWRIAIWDFLNRKKIEIPPMEKGAIASSGAEHNFFSMDRRWHHIINPKTLIPPVHIVGASAVGPSATVCDILSTTLFILPDKDRRRILATQYPEYKYWVMGTEGQIESTIY